MKNRGVAKVLVKSQKSCVGGKKKPHLESETRPSSTERKWGALGTTLRWGQGALPTVITTTALARRDFPPYLLWLCLPGVDLRGESERRGGILSRLGPTRAPLRVKRNPGLFTTTVNRGQVMRNPDV